MGWGNCGTDSKGRGIGYLFDGTCDHPGCEEKLNRRLSYACGGMHGQNGLSCEGYFCEKHTKYARCDEYGGNLCFQCTQEAIDSGLILCDECAHFVEEDDYLNDEEMCEPCFHKSLSLG